MHHVYIIQSQIDKKKIYIGYTTDLKRRIIDHNEGNSTYTSSFRPWRLITYLTFSDKMTALEFEKYLKGHSGQAFLQKRLI